ncbi:acylphosphatase [Aquimarina aquimarini]|uniref:acylphosphatase n=1 Tax=Aquimarina aquimarini TaxID=1191734 RepID=UPI001F2DCC0E|nr:acylphosphatase [Aquimarina aquimarini]
MLKHYKITVTGKVQGVWYRKNTHEKAKELTIKGFVENQPNGNVYLEAEGDANQLKALLEWCAIGPEYAKVATVSYQEDNLQFFESFEIRK